MDKTEFTLTPRARSCGVPSLQRLLLADNLYNPQDFEAQLMQNYELEIVRYLLNCANTQHAAGAPQRVLALLRARSDRCDRPLHCLAPRVPTAGARLTCSGRGLAVTMAA